jgi:murein DD-endopeptidase MepM/ murein hydrolase activator NlpD
MWSIVMKGYTTDLKTGNVASIEERRKTLEAMGGDLDYFDKRVKEETVTAYKKTIGTEDGTSAILKEYLMTEYGYTEGKISTEILCEYDVAKDFQLAMCANNEQEAVDALVVLMNEGITEADIYTLYENRYKAIEIGDLTTGEFKAPVSGTVTSGFGPREAPTAGASSYHEGIDIAAPAGTVVGAADGGKVSSCGYNKTEGYYVKINHGNGRYTVYKHLEGFCVSKGQAVGPEQEIGRVGSTGISTGPHLHFAVIDNGKYMDPAMYLN